jgi:hypothetical protein
MKTLENPQDREELSQRLGDVRADSERHRDKMSAHQMICHLADRFRGVMGEKEVKPMSRSFARKFVKWVALYAPMPWPHGVKTRPEMDQQMGGTQPGDFDADVRELRRLFEKFTRRPLEFQRRRHPIFLEMSEKDWLRWGYLHIDHHLRQFGA